MKHKDKNKTKPKWEKESEPKNEELEELRSQAEALEEEKDELFGKLQRVSADYANFQKRSIKQTADTIAFEKKRIIKTLLPILDNFEHTLQNKHQAVDADTLLKGVEIIYEQMLNILKLHGVEQIKALEENFDPALHEAMMQRAEPEKQDNIVLEEFQKGYKLNGQVIRPSKVVVNKLASEHKQQDKSDSQVQQGDEEQSQSTE